MTCAGLDPHKDQSELARRVGDGCKPQTIQYLLNQNKNAKSSRYTPRLAFVLGCDVNWLADGKGRKPEVGLQKSGKQSAQLFDIANYNESSHGDNYSGAPELRTRLYPLITFRQATMRADIAEPSEAPDDEGKFQCHIDLGERGYVLRVDDVSMTAPAGIFPTFPPGFLLYVRPAEHALPGSFVIVQRGASDATFKRLSLVDGELYLEALNPDWPNRFLKMQITDRILGVIMHAGFDLSNPGNS